MKIRRKRRLERRRTKSDDIYPLRATVFGLWPKKFTLYGQLFLARGQKSLRFLALAKKRDGVKVDKGNLNRSKMSEITIRWPASVRVLGLPLILQGWNNKYYLSDNISEGCPIYRMDSYNLFGIIPIIGVSLVRKGGLWVLQRDCDFLGEA